MTFAPMTLLELAAYWKRQGGVNLGIVGDTAHLDRGVSYHLGRDQLIPGAYSALRPRDRAGLSNAASAIDLGRLDGSYTHLRAFSDWLARRCVKQVPGTGDVVEVIYSPDGKRVLGFKDGVDFLIPDYGDASHLTHTHISFYRDSEFREKTALFAPYFVEDPMRSFTFGPEAQSGTVTVNGDDHLYLRLLDNTLHAIADKTVKTGFGPVKLVGGGITGPGDPRDTGYVIGDEAAFVLEEDVHWAVGVVVAVNGTTVFP